jgi:hypothetical protein
MNKIAIDTINKKRKIWVINPNSRIIPKKPKYNRQIEKQKLKKEIY